MLNEHTNKTNSIIENVMTGYPSIDKPWLKYYKKRPKDLIYPHKTLYQFVYDNNIDYLNNIAFQYFDKQISYNKFFENVNKAAKAFVDIGVKAGDIVTIMSMHTPETIYTVYGLNYIGAVANLVYPTLTENELLQTLSNTESKAFFVLDVILEKSMINPDKISIPIIVLPVDRSMPLPIKVGYMLKNAISQNKKKCTRVISYHDFIKKKSDIQNAVLALDSTTTAVIVYTSGTTGEPKGVMLSNDSLNCLATQDYNGLLDFQRGKNSLLILPPFIGFGISMLHVQLGAGIKSILQIVLEPEDIYKSLFRYKPYCYMTGPALIENLLSHRPSDLSPLKYFLSGGGHVTEEQIFKVNTFLTECGTKANFSNGYGMTEAGVVLCLACNEINKLGSVGIPFIDTNVKVVDIDSLEELKYDKIGELWFTCPNLMSGYYKNTKATNEVIFVDNTGTRWLRTGDLGHVDKDGFVFIDARIKRIYITRGKDNMAYKLFPQQMEEIIKRVDEVDECGVIVHEDKTRINVGVVFVLPKDPMIYKEISEKDKLCNKLFDFALSELPEHMQPTEIHIIDKMPITHSGKINYRELEKMM